MICVGIGLCGSLSVVSMLPLLAGIAAREDVEARIVMTRTAASIVPPSTAAQALSCDVLTDEALHRPGPPAHVELAGWADIWLVCPATANALATVVAGLAPNLLATTLLSTTAPTAFVPVMTTTMWQHLVRREIPAQLEALGYRVLKPVSLPSTDRSVGGDRQSLTHLPGNITRLIDELDGQR